MLEDLVLEVLHSRIEPKRARYCVTLKESIRDQFPSGLRASLLSESSRAMLQQCEL